MSYSTTGHQLVPPPAPPPTTTTTLTLGQPPALPTHHFTPGSLPTMVALPTSPIPCRNLMSTASGQMGSIVPNLPSYPVPPSALNGMTLSNTVHTKASKSSKKSKGKSSSKKEQLSSVTNSAIMETNTKVNQDELVMYNNFEVSNQCSQCDYYCDKKDRMRRHIRTVHLKAKPFGCSLCSYTVGRKDKLKRHIETVHTNMKPFKCDYCSHTSNRKDKIKVHIESVHFKTRPPSKGSHKKKNSNSLSVKNEPPTSTVPPTPTSQYFQVITEGDFILTS